MKNFIKSIQMRILELDYMKFHQHRIHTKRKFWSVDTNLNNNLITLLILDLFEQNQGTTRSKMGPDKDQ